MRCGDDHASGHPPGAGKVGNTGSGDHAGAVDIDTDGGQTFGDPIGNPGAGLTRVLSDHGQCFWRGADQVVAEGAAD